MPKGKHKGGRRCFTNFEELQNQKDKEEKEREWRKARGELASDSEGAEDSEEKEESESSEENEEDGEEKKPKAKGTEGLIEIENPNHVAPKFKKISTLTSGDESKPQYSRKEREEIEKQKKAAHYRKLHAQGKTEEARADLERLALIRKQREEAQKKKEEDKKAKEEAAALKREKLGKSVKKGSAS